MSKSLCTLHMEFGFKARAFIAIQFFFENLISTIKHTECDVLYHLLTVIIFQQKINKSRYEKGEREYYDYEN